MELKTAFRQAISFVGKLESCDYKKLIRIDSIKSPIFDNITPTRFESAAFYADKFSFSAHIATNAYSDYKITTTNRVG